MQILGAKKTFYLFLIYFPYQNTIDIFKIQINWFYIINDQLMITSLMAHSYTKKPFDQLHITQKQK